MSLKNFKTLVAESIEVEWFQNYSVDINYPNINFKLNIKGVTGIYEFIQKQAEGFSNLENLPPELLAIKEIFKQAVPKMEDLVRTQNLYNNQWNDVLHRVLANSPIKFLYDSPETEFLIRISELYPLYYPGAYQFLVGNTQQVSNKNELIGYLLAYEFTIKDFSYITERKDAEKRSIATIRTNFQKQLGESEAQLVEYLAEANKQYDKYAKQIDKLKEEKDELFSKWFDSTSEKSVSFQEAANGTVKDLEDLYRKKLKLEAPAKYWTTRARKLRKEGNLWLAGLVFSIGATVLILMLLLNKFSDEKTLKIFEHTGTAIKWSILLITTISFLAFAIKSFSKLTFSSFHLMRDAEEKEQLTYVYLALSKEKVIDETERHLIMQSLFSRADTGLLKDDGSPTMPGGILDKALAK